MTQQLTKGEKIELVIGGILFGLFNNVSTIWNAKVLLEEGHKTAGGLTIFFLMFPGIVTSIGFVVLHWLGTRRFGKIPPFEVLVYFFALLFFYPIVPIALCFNTLRTGKNRDLAIMSKLLGGFLDDGPQFVIRVVVVVLFGIGSESKSDIIFIMSMVTSFGNLVYYGLQFNERKTTSSVKWLLAFPMFAASVAARGFTLSVFLKETIQTGETIKSELIGALIVLTIYFAVNIALFRVNRQDLVRSLLFGLSSTLIPAGYNNDEYFYQCPNQPINDFDDKFETYGTQNSDSASAPYAAPMGAGGFVIPTPSSVSPANLQIEEPQTTNGVQHEKMRSGLFLVLHTIVNTILLSSCAIYISATRDLSNEANNALVLPQVLAVVPGCFFTLARSILLVDVPSICHEKIWKITQVTLAVVFGIIAVGSLIPALFGSLIWKVGQFATEFFEDDD